MIRVFYTSNRKLGRIAFQHKKSADFYVHPRFSFIDDTMEAFRIQRVLWTANSAPAVKVDGESGPVYYSRIFLPGKDNLPSRNQPSGIPLKGRHLKKAI